MAATQAWVAVYEDRSDFALFSSEIAAYRHANGKQMIVVPWPFGKSLSEVLSAPRETQ